MLTFVLSFFLLNQTQSPQPNNVNVKFFFSYILLCDILICVKSGLLMVRIPLDDVIVARVDFYVILLPISVQ
jgi:hypothetical protein